MLYILDFDGTLADTQSAIVQTSRQVLAELRLPPVDDAAICATIGLPLRECFMRAAGIREEAVLERALTLYRDLFDDIALRQVRLFPTVAQTLRTLHEAGHQLSIATSRTRASLDPMLDRLGIGALFCFICTDEMVKGKKPLPDMVQLTLQTLQQPVQSALVVGDTAFDIRMGRDAGCRTCGVTYGNQSRQQLAEAQADYIIDRFEQLIQITTPCI
ncbi:MAG: HAD family hydrolase [Paludibacteraceae bacterium]|nr:HAD family hydrolase [Paludibacteraceae bacterium]